MDKKELLASVLHFISTLEMDADSKDIVVQTLSEATGVSASNAAIAPFDLSQVFQAGTQVLAGQHQQFSSKVFPTLQSKGYFNGCAPDSAEYGSRMASARMKFFARQLAGAEATANGASLPSADATSTAAFAPASTPAIDLAKADEYKV
jgi:hypothetical protein